MNVLYERKNMRVFLSILFLFFLSFSFFLFFSLFFFLSLTRLFPPLQYEELLDYVAENRMTGTAVIDSHSTAFQVSVE